MKDKNVEDLQEFIEILCRGMVAHPEEISAEMVRHQETGEISAIVHRNPKDYPKLIGKSGANYTTLCRLAIRAGKRIKENVSLFIPSELGKIPGRRAGFKPKRKWEAEEFVERIKLLSNSLLDDVEVWHKEADDATQIEILVDSCEESKNVGKDLSYVAKIHGKSQGRQVRLRVYCRSEIWNRQ